MFRSTTISFIACIGFATAAVALPACGSDDPSATPDAAPTPTPDAGPPPLLEPPPAGQGIQFTMRTRLEAGVEAEHCMFVRVPAGSEPLWVNRDEVRYGLGSHHFLLYATSYTEIPTHKDDGTPVDTSKVFDCSDGATNGWSVTKLIGGSQNGVEGDSMLRFPPDVAIKVPAGAVLLMNAHYINATDAPLEPEVYINLWTIPAAQVAQEGDLLFLYNPFIKVAANGTGRARWRCPVRHDITIANVQSHMHRRGVGYEATVVGEEPFYVGTEWENVLVKRFEPGMVVHAGQFFDYHCDYQNPEAHDVYQGPRSVNEMCMLIGSYYPADPATANCRDDEGNLAGEWVGNGTATCAATWTCLQGALGQSGSGLKGVTDCVDKASPEVAAESSALIRCLFKTGDPSMCGAEISACSAK
jgi:hypothetical protein